MKSIAHVPTAGCLQNVLESHARVVSAVKAGSEITGALDQAVLAITHRLREHGSRGTALVESVDSVEAILAAAPAPAISVTPVTKGRPVSPRGEARRVVAEAAGVSEGAVRTAEHRAAKAVEAEKVEPSTVPARLEAFNNALEECLGGLRHWTTRVKALGTAGAIVRAVADLREVTSSLGAQRLVVACPKHTGDRCGLCFGVGGLTEFQLAGIPADERPRVPAPVKDYDCPSDEAEDF